MPTYLRRLNSQLFLAGTAVFAFVWAIVRACVQSVTIDEASTYISWVARTGPVQWEAASNNHVLNSLLIRLFTSVFGPSPLTLRIPALFGAAIYIAAAYAFCRMVTDNGKLQWALFVCLVYNPFVFDYLVAARGYSLAMAFLLATHAIAAHAQLPRLGREARDDVPVCIACSICAAVSFAANFAFGIVDAAVMLMILVWFCGSTRGIAARARLLAACTLPGLLVTLFLAGPVLLNWPKPELHFGAASLRETLDSVVRSSLYQLNPDLVNPLILGWMGRPKHFLLPLLAATAVVPLIRAARRRTADQDPHSAWLRALGAVLLGATALALLVHWLAFRLFHVLLPMDRTAVFFVPLLTLLFGIAAAFPAPARAWDLCRRALLVTMFAVSLYFLGCLRLGYFREWQWDADLKKVYPVLAYYNRTYCVRDFVANWMYGAPLNFYRLTSGQDTISEIRGPLAVPADGLIYVLDRYFDGDFIQQQKLRVVYRGDTTRVVVAIRSEVETRPCRVATVP